MAEELKDDFPDATRGLFAAIGFILLFIGGDMIAEKEGLRVGLGLFLVLLGVACSYAAAFWQSAKKILSAEAQHAIGNFARSRNTWLHVIVIIFLMLIFSPFVEQHRWPFSFPADPAVYKENAELKNASSAKNEATLREKVLADKWRFADTLRQLGRSCRYQIQVTRKVGTAVYFWQELFRAGGWNGDLGPQSGAIQPGIVVIRTAGDASQCAGTLQRALTDIYPNPPSKIAPNQQTEFLGSCGSDCVQIEIDY